MAEAALAVITTVLVLGAIWFLSTQTVAAYRERGEILRRVRAIETRLFGESADAERGNEPGKVYVVPERISPRDPWQSLPSYEVTPEGNVLWSDGSLTTPGGETIRGPRVEQEAGRA